MWVAREDRERLCPSENGRSETKLLQQARALSRAREWSRSGTDSVSDSLLLDPPPGIMQNPFSILSADKLLLAELAGTSSSRNLVFNLVFTLNYSAAAAANWTDSPSENASFRHLLSTRLSGLTSILPSKSGSLLKFRPNSSCRELGPSTLERPESA